MVGSGNSKRSLIPVKTGILALILGGGLFASLFVVINFTRPPRTPVVAVTAALTVIPSWSGTGTPTNSAALPTELPAATPTLMPGAVGNGVFVQVSDTGGDGLRLRKEPGLSHEMQFLGLDGELFLIGDGPVESDGYTWWFVIGSYDETRQGWAVADFLSVVPNP
jgi:hypothetical protein